MKAHIERMSKNKFVQGGAILTASHYAASFLNYLFNSLSAKALGPSGFSEIAALFAYVSILSIPTIVITTIIIRRLGQAGEHRNAVGKEFEQWFIKQSKRLIIFVPFLYLLVLFLPSVTNLSSLSIVTLITLLILNLVSVIYISLLQGLHLFIQFSIATILIVGFKFIGALAAYAGFGALPIIYLFVLIGTASPLLFGKWSLSQIKPASGNYSFKKKVRSIILQKNIIVTAISLISISIVGNLDIILAKKIFDGYNAGLYSAWSLFAKIILYFIGPINMISLIFFSAKENKRHRKKTMMIILGLFIIVGLSLYVGYVFFGEILINIIFNSDYASIQPLLGLAALFGFLYTYITLMNNYFLSQNSKSSLIVAISVPFYIGLLLLFGANMHSFIMINIGVTATMCTLYFISFLRS